MGTGLAFGIRQVNVYMAGVGRELLRTGGLLTISKSS